MTEESWCCNTYLGVDQSSVWVWWVNLPFIEGARTIVVVVPGSEGDQVLGEDHHLPPGRAVALQAGEVLVDVIGLLHGGGEAAVVPLPPPHLRPHCQPLPQHQPLLASQPRHRSHCNI